MPQTVTITSDAYDFSELSDAAKERARSWYREGSFEDDFDCTLEDFVTIGELIGIDFKTHNVNLYGGGTRQEPNIYWSGFCSQGDGACFEGTYDYKADAGAKLREHAPQDEVLHKIVDELARVQAENGYGLRATITHRDNHYYHSRTMSVEVIDRRNEDRSDDAINAAETAIGELMVSLADWLYKALDDENDYRMSDEAVDESIEANEYKFDEDGHRHAFA